jgi:hypothetical protein
MRIRAAVAAALILVSVIPPALAIDEAEIQAALQSRMCPKEPIDTTHMPDYAVCKPLEPDFMKVDQCQNQQDRIWKLALKYNELYKACHANDDHGSSIQTSKPSGTALAKQAEEAKQKANEAKAKAQQAADRQEQVRKSAEEQKNRLKAQANSVPSWCQGMISSCQQRASSLANATAGTQSQCNAYCQILQVEDCNGASSTVQQAAQACNSGAQRDQKEAMEEDKRRREAKRRREEEANRIPSGWVKCPCPADDMYLIAQGRAKLINGVLYHPQDVGPCGGR